LIVEKAARLWSRASIHQQGALTYHRSKDRSVVPPKLLSIASTLLDSNEDQSRRKNSHDERNEEQAEAMVLNSDSLIRTDEEGHFAGADGSR